MTKKYLCSLVVGRVNYKNNKEKEEREREGESIPASWDETEACFSPCIEDHQCEQYNETLRRERNKDIRKGSPVSECLHFEGLY